MGDRKCLVGELSDTRAIDGLLKSLARATDADEFVELFEKASQDCCDVRLRPLDKKTEKGMVRDLRAKIAEEIEGVPTLPRCSLSQSLSCIPGFSRWPSVSRERR